VTTAPKKAPVERVSAKKTTAMVSGDTKTKTSPRAEVTSSKPTPPPQPKGPATKTTAELSVKAQPPTPASEQVWVKLVARPKGTRIYVNKVMVGKSEAVIRWKRSERPPRVTLKKWKYETYKFRIPARKIGKTHRVRLEWDDSR